MHKKNKTYNAMHKKNPWDTQQDWSNNYHRYVTILQFVGWFSNLYYNRTSFSNKFVLNKELKQKPIIRRERLLNHIKSKLIYSNLHILNEAFVRSLNLRQIKLF